uniref:Uncharacterized protein n=1 Tax=Anguilla anguilla TaxID=7936 RepID=A0A0E9T1M9_ANGAN
MNYFRPWKSCSNTRAVSYVCVKALKGEVKKKAVKELHMR